MAKRGKFKKPPPRPAPAALATPKAPVGAPEAEARRGFAAFVRGEYSEAVRAWQRARQSAPSPALDRALAEAHFRRALAAPNPARRIQDLHEAAALIPERPAYQFHLGLAHYGQGQPARALTALETAHRLAPDNARFRDHLALLLLTDAATAPRVHDLLARAARQDETASRLRALAALRTGDPAAAVRLLAGRSSSSPLARLTLGLARLAAGDAAAAIAALTAFQKDVRPRSVQAGHTAALALLLAHQRSGELGTALVALRSQPIPDDAGLRRASARVAQQLGAALVLEEQLDQAAEAWERALALEPGAQAVRRGVVHLREVLGIRAARADDLLSAALHWTIALDHQPDNARVLHNLALAEERLGLWERASAHWEELIKIWRKEAPASRRGDEAAERRRRLGVAFSHLATTLEAADDPSAAARALDRSLNFDPTAVDLRLRAARRYVKIEEYHSAIEHYRRAQVARPNDIQIMLELAAVYNAQGNDRLAFSQLERAQALEPDHPAVPPALASAHHTRGHKALDAKRYEDAATEFKRAAALEPSSWNHVECLGDAYLGLKRQRDAAAAFARAVALDPASVPLRVSIGGRYLKHNDAKEAERFFRQALRIENSVITQMMIGMSYLHAGRTSDAHRYFKRFLKGDHRAQLVLIGNAMCELHLYTDALPYLERAVILNPMQIAERLSLSWAFAAGPGNHYRAGVEVAAAEAQARRQGDKEMLEEIAELRKALALLKQYPDMASAMAAAGGRLR